MTLRALPTLSPFELADTFAAEEAVTSVGISDHADDFGPSDDCAGGSLSAPEAAVEDVTEFPGSIYQTAAGTSFSSILRAAPEIARDGVAAIQLAPTSLPYRRLEGEVRDPVLEKILADKPVSVYAPEVLHRLNPVLWGGQTLRDLLDGKISSHIPGSGWMALRQFTDSLKAMGINSVVADMVLGHSARAQRVVDAYRNHFGEFVYELDPTQWDGIAVRSGLQSTGTPGEWRDVAPFNFTGPARAALLDYHTNVFLQYLRAGVSVFRFDAAQYLLPGNYFGDLMAGVREAAGAQGLPTPMFYAEVLGDYPGVQDDILATIRAGANAANASTHWWDLRGDWYVNLHNRVMDAGGRMLAFPTNADTPRMLDTQELLMRTVLSGATSAYSYMQGAHYGRKPTVFMGELTSGQGIDVYFGHQTGSAAIVQTLLRMVNALKGEPVFARDFPLRLNVNGPLTRVTKIDPETGQMAIIAIHNGRDERGNIYSGKLAMSVPFEGAGILYANNKHVGWIPNGRDMAGNEVKNFELIPYGIAVFYEPRAGAASRFASRVAMGGRFTP